MIARQHIPSFVEGVEPAYWHFNDEASLRALPFVRRETDAGYALQISECHGTHTLMAVAADEYWVIAYLDGDVPSLPRWSATA